MRLNGHMLPQILLGQESDRVKEGKGNVIEDWFGLQKRLLHRVQTKAKQILINFEKNSRFVVKGPMKR